MERPTCPHCGEPLPSVVDAFCPACREPLEGPPPVADGLTRGQRTLLTAYRGFRSSPPTVGKLLLRSVPTHLFLVALVGGLAGVYSYLGVDAAALVALGALAGVLLRDLGWFIQSVRVWPAVAAVIDWSRVDELLAGGEGVAEDRPPGPTPPRDPVPPGAAP